MALFDTPGPFPLEFQDLLVVLDDELFISLAGLLTVGFKFLLGFFKVLFGLSGNRKTSFEQKEENDQ
jgi:hypothetical protein